MIDRTMAEIGALARQGGDPSRSILQQVEQIARAAPLAPEPYLVHGALAQAEGQPDRAERLFAEARLRDPRSEAARYFLADRYLRTGRDDQALAEVAAFSRLVPGASAQFAPALAGFARTPGAIPQLRTFFRSSPEFEPLVLGALAADPGNADLILALAGPADGSADPGWQARLVAGLVEQRQYARAYSVWRKVSGVRGGANGLFNPRFQKLSAPAPFNWTFSTQGGVAEPNGDGQLQLIYYGREDAVLAQQLLLLRPGRYQLRMSLSGQAGDGSAISWSVTCLPQNRAIFALPLKQGERQAAGVFSIPSGCPAQRLELTGTAGEFPKSLDITISGLALTRAAAQ